MGQHFLIDQDVLTEVVKCIKIKRGEKIIEVGPGKGVLTAELLKKGAKVLVVEDIALNQLLMKTLLDDFGFERDIASNGKIAIEKLKDNNYDIILMDLQVFM